MKAIDGSQDLSPSPDGYAPGVTVADRFVLIDRIGRGGFGEVWLADDTHALGRRVALKLLHASHRKKERILNRFRTEASLLTRLEHPAIARALDCVVNPNLAFLAMEYAEGVTLAKEISARAQHSRAFTKAQLLLILRALADALDYSHKMGIIHRDLKPSNIMLLSKPEQCPIKVLDFGVAKVLNKARDDSTTQGRRLGTWLYMSPEQVLGGRVTSKSDLFSVGALIFEMLTFKKAFLTDQQGKPISVDEVQRLPDPMRAYLSVPTRIARGARPKARDFVASLPQEVDDVIAKALAIDPDERFPSASYLASAFAEALEGKRFSNPDATLADDSPATIVDDATGPLPTVHATGGTVVRTVFAPREGERTNDPLLVAPESANADFFAGPRELPAVFGAYFLLRRFEADAISLTYLAKRKNSIIPLRIKLIHGLLARHESDRAKFEKSVMLARQIATPTFPQIVDGGILGATPFVVSEFSPGLGFSAVLEHVTALGRPLRLQAAFSVVLQLLEGLLALKKHSPESSEHVAGQDVRPRNLTLGADGHMRFVELSLGRVDARQESALSGRLMDSIGYLAPEQLLHGAVDERWQVYVLAEILFELITGRPHIVRGPFHQMLAQAVNPNPILLSSLRRDVPSWLDGLMARALSRDVDARPASLTEFHAELESLAESVARLAAVELLDDDLALQLHAAEDEITRVIAEPLPLGLNIDDSIAPFSLWSRDASVPDDPASDDAVEPALDAIPDGLLDSLHFIEERAEMDVMRRIDPALMAKVLRPPDALAKTRTAMQRSILWALVVVGVIVLFGLVLAAVAK